MDAECIICLQGLWQLSVMVIKQLWSSISLKILKFASILIKIRRV